MEAANQLADTDRTTKEPESNAIKNSHRSA
jgi:hypothetical protein